MAIAVEQAKFVPGAKPANRGKMAGFRSSHVDCAWQQRTVEVKSFGHFCYNRAAMSPGRVDPGVKEKGFSSEDAMSSAVPPSGKELSSLQSTRQMLDELDALM